MGPPSGPHRRSATSTAASSSQSARISIQSGHPDRALDLIEPLLDKPGDITAAWLRIDPVFKPLTSDPRFHRLASLQ